jgi:hypothetical protein
MTVVMPSDEIVDFIGRGRFQAHLQLKVGGKWLQNVSIEAGGVVIDLGGIPGAKGIAQGKIILFRRGGTIPGQRAQQKRGDKLNFHGGDIGIQFSLEQHGLEVGRLFIWGEDVSG